MTSIGDSAFSGCSSLTGITIPEGVKSIGDAAFFCCDSLVDQDGFIVIRGILHHYSGPGGEVRIPEGVTRIGSCVFCVCDTITGVIIPETVTSIGSFAFFMCTNLTSVTIPKGVTNIGEVAFSVHSGTREVIIYTPYAASFFNDLKEQVDRDRYENIWYYAINYEPEELILIYLGGPLSDLPEECRKSAAGGFMYALEKGITEVDQWREEYLEYIRNNVNIFIKEAEYEKHILLFLMKEKLLDEEATMRFLKEYKYYSFNEVKAALVKYYLEFGIGSQADQ